MKYKFDIVYNDQEKVDSEGRAAAKKEEGKVKNEEWWVKVFDLISLWSLIINKSNLKTNSSSFL